MKVLQKLFLFGNCLGIVCLLILRRQSWNGSNVFLFCRSIIFLFSVSGLMSN